MKKRWLSILLALCVTSELAAGCGQTGTAANEPVGELVSEAADEPGSEPASETADEPVSEAVSGTADEPVSEVVSGTGTEEDQPAETGYHVSDLIGTPTDYSDAANWAHLPENADKPVDTFFIYPTVYINPAEDAPDIVPIDDELMRQGVASNYEKQPALFEDLTNLYEPYYRQTNLASIIGKDGKEFMEFQYQEQRTDVYAALDYYFEHYNQGKPYILAGHSQGSMMLKIALIDYFKEHTELLDRMVACYAIGYSITTEDLQANPALKFAEGASDTGVIVSWNTEGPENDGQANAVVQKNAISINPITWTLDEERADASQNLGSHIPTTDAEGNTTFTDEVPGVADAAVNKERGVVICTTLSDSYISVGALGEDVENPFGPASLHNMDYAAYWENIRENVKTRIGAYQASHT